MAINLQTLIVPLVLDSSKYGKDLNTASQKTDGFATKMTSMGQTATKVGIGMTVGLTAPIVAGFGAATMAASDLEQSIGGIDAIFGTASVAITAFGETSAQTVGLSTRAFNEMAAQTGAQLQNMGFSQDEAAKKAIELTQRASDMAATFGGPVSEAMGAINSLLRGQSDPIEKYGAGMTAVEIKARALELGLGDLDGKIDEAAKTTARLSLLNERTAATEGQFAREADTLAGIMERQKAETENLSAEIGTILMPIMLDIAKAVGGFMESYKKLSPEIKKVIVIIGGILAVLGPLFLVFGTIVSVVTTLAPVFATIGAIIGGIAAGPVLLIIAGVAAIIAIFLLLRANWDTIVKFLVKTWEGFKNTFKRVVDAIKGFIQGLMGKLGAIKQKLLDAIPSWLIPGSATEFEIGLRGIRKELVRVDTGMRPTHFTQSLPDIGRERIEDVGRRRDMFDYDRFGRIIAHELQKVMG